MLVVYKNLLVIEYSQIIKELTQIQIKQTSSTSNIKWYSRKWYFQKVLKMQHLWGGTKIIGITLNKYAR